MTNISKKNGTTSQVYSFNLMTRIIRHFSHLIDLHTASKGRVNSLYVRANMQNPTTRHMARLQNPQIIVHNTSPDGSLRGAAMQEYNIPAITVEIGDPSRFQKRFVKSAILGVTNILSHLKMVEDEHEVQDYDPVVCAKSVSFIFISFYYVPVCNTLRQLKSVNTSTCLSIGYSPKEAES